MKPQRSPNSAKKRYRRLLTVEELEDRLVPGETLGAMFLLPPAVSAAVDAQVRDLPPADDLNVAGGQAPRASEGDRSAAEIVLENSPSGPGIGRWVLSRQEVGEGSTRPTPPAPETTPDQGERRSEGTPSPTERRSADSSVPRPEKGSPAARLKRNPAAADFDSVLDDSTLASADGLGDLDGADKPSATGSPAVSEGSGGGGGGAAGVSPAPAANVAGPLTDAGARPASGSFPTTAPAGPTAPAGTEAALLASMERTAPEIDSGSPNFQAAATKSSSKVSSSKTSGQGYIYYRYGSQTDITPTTAPTPGLGLEGGGTDIDPFYQWMGARAHGGDFLVLGTTNDNAYDSYVYGLNQTAGTPLNSVSTLDISSSAATSNPTSAQFVVDKIDHAEAIFIKGGDQSTYVNLWQTPLSSGAPNPIQQALDRAAARGVPIGGTSAGLAVLGQYVYSAENASAVSSTVLANPYDSSITLDQDFLSIPGQQSLPDLGNTITDSHFYERDRMGRLVTFLARLVEDPRWTPPSPTGGTAPLQGQGTKGIGIDESTALLIDPATGVGTVIGTPGNHLYFLETSGSPPGTQNGTSTLSAPLTWGSVNSPAILAHRATVNDTFNLQTWQPVSDTGGADYKLWAGGGSVFSTQAGGSIY
jgi:cyanophycinase-like exopeptidase